MTLKEESCKLFKGIKHRDGSLIQMMQCFRFLFLTGCYLRGGKTEIGSDQEVEMTGGCIRIKRKNPFENSASSGHMELRGDKTEGPKVHGLTNHFGCKVGISNSIKRPCFEENSARIFNTIVE